MSQILTEELRKQNPNPFNVTLTIENYAEVVVKRTLNTYTDMNYNNQHMVSGFTSELTDELLSALNSKDNTNVVEELGDGTFFTVGFLILNQLFDKYIDKIKTTDNLLLNLGFEWSDNETQSNFTPEHRNALFNGVLFDTFKVVGALNTITKNILIKNTPKYEGKILSEEEIVEKAMSLLICINTLSHMTGNSILTVRNVNNEKLFARYSGGTFDPKMSLERNVSEERKLMEETMSKEIVDGMIPNKAEEIVTDAQVIPIESK